MDRKSRAVFLDRDGTISEEIGYIDSAENFELYPYAIGALSELQSSGYKLIVVTNQSGVARGYFPESRVKEVNDLMCSLLAKQGVAVDAVYYCPHHPDGIVKDFSFECQCRKPGTGMIKQAERELNLDIKNSIMIGDKRTDIDCGRNAGMKTILLRTGFGKDEEKLLNGRTDDEMPDFMADDLNDAVEWIKNEI